MRIDYLQNNKSFNSRCKAIKDGQKVVRAINAEVPHVRLSLHTRIFEKILDREIYDEYEKQSQMISVVNNMINEFISLRNYFDNGKDNLFEFIKKYKVGNCWEDSQLAALIMNYNGYNNVYVANFEKNGLDVDHVVCLYNKDDSPIKDCKIINNKTIVLDAWSGIVDFAGNYFSKLHDKFMAEPLNCPKDGTFMFTEISRVKLKSDTKDVLDEKFPKLQLKNMK